MSGRTDFLVERDGFEPEISLTVLPRTQSETPVRRLEQVKPALNAAKLPTDGSVVGHRRLAGWTNSWRSRTFGQCARCVRIFADWTSWRPPLALVSLLEFAPVGPARARKVWPHASNGRTRRIADVADSNVGRLSWADCGPSRVAREGQESFTKRASIFALGGRLVERASAAAPCLIAGEPTTSATRIAASSGSRSFLGQPRLAQALQ